MLTVIATIAFAAATLALGYVQSLWLLLPSLALGGLAWMATMASFNVSAQSAAPDWVRARALGIYLLVFQGGMAASSFAWGAIAGWLGDSGALLLAAVLLCLSATTAWRWRLHRLQGLDLTQAEQTPQVEVASTPQPEDGPVLITILYEVAPDQQSDFVKAMERVERMRRRTGAYRWGLFQDTDNPHHFVETYLARSWAEHMRQHTRATVTDRQIVEAARALQEPGTSPVVSHLIAAHPVAFDGGGGERGLKGRPPSRRKSPTRK